MVSAMCCSACQNTSACVNTDITYFLFFCFKCLSFWCFCIFCIRICKLFIAQQSVCILGIWNAAVQHGIICIKSSIFRCNYDRILVGTSVRKITPHFYLIQLEYIAKIDLEVYAGSCQYITFNAVQCTGKGVWTFITIDHFFRTTFFVWNILIIICTFYCDVGSLQRDFSVSIRNNTGISAAVSANCWSCFFQCSQLKCCIFYFCLAYLKISSASNSQSSIFQIFDVFLISACIQCTVDINFQTAILFTDTCNVFPCSIVYSFFGSYGYISNCKDCFSVFVNGKAVSTFLFQNVHIVSGCLYIRRYCKISGSCNSCSVQLICFCKAKYCLSCQCFVRCFRYIICILQICFCWCFRYNLIFLIYNFCIYCCCIAG